MVFATSRLPSLEERIEQMDEDAAARAVMAALLWKCSRYHGGQYGFSQVCPTAQPDICIKKRWEGIGVSSHKYCWCLCHKKVGYDVPHI